MVCTYKQEQTEMADQSSELLWQVVAGLMVPEINVWKFII